MARSVRAAVLAIAAVAAVLSLAGSARAGVSAESALAEKYHVAHEIDDLGR